MEGIQESEYRDRVRRVQSLARVKRLDAILAYSDRRYSMGQGVESGENVRYLVGFKFPPHEIHERDVAVPYMVGDCLLVVPQEGDPSLIISQPEIDTVKNQTWIRDIRSTADKFDIFTDAKYRGFAEICKEIVLRKRTATLGIGGTRTPMGLYLGLIQVFPGSRLVECQHEMEMFRVVKTPGELRIMRKAAEIADEGVKALIESSKPGVAEYEVHQSVEKAMFDAGGDNPWTVIQSGPRATISYMSPDYTQRKLREGDMIYADIGSELMGYHSDLQPAYVVGQGNAKQIKIIETSLKMLKAMFAATRSGATDTEVLKAAYKVLNGNPLRPHVRTWVFGHGYGVGLDPPDITGATLTLPRSKQLKLQENMVLCLEPGIFVPGIGGAAVEDEVIVTADGCEILTKCAKLAQVLLDKQRSI